MPSEAGPRSNDLSRVSRLRCSGDDLGSARDAHSFSSLAVSKHCRRPLQTEIPRASTDPSESRLTKDARGNRISGFKQSCMQFTNEKNDWWYGKNGYKR